MYFDILNNMKLIKLVLLAVSIVVLGCKGDNDDIIEPNDVINVDLTQGITFGLIDSSGPNVIYQYTNQGVFLIDNANEEITSETVWTRSQCPFSQASVTAGLTADVPNLARGIRDIASTDITTTIALGGTFYILEYVTSGITKRIQFTSGSGFNEEQINTYLSYIIETIAILNISTEAPLNLNTSTNVCE